MNVKSSRIDYPQIVSVSFLFVKPLFLFLLLFFSMKSCFFWYKHLFSLETMLSVLHQFTDFQWMGLFCVTVRWFVSFEISNLNFGAAGACRPVGYRFSAKCCSVQLWVNWKENQTGSELIVVGPTNSLLYLRFCSSKISASGCHFRLIYGYRNRFWPNNPARSSKDLWPGRIDANRSPKSASAAWKPTPNWTNLERSVLIY